LCKKLKDTVSPTFLEAVEDGKDDPEKGDGLRRKARGFLHIRRQSRSPQL
jgi:hypothetical protein